MIPLRDELPSRRRPVMTVLIIIADVLVFLYQLSLQYSLGPRMYEGFIMSFGLVPAFVSGYIPVSLPFPAPLTILTSMFLHGGFMHIAGNMLFLWIFGDNVEDVMGRWRFLAFYILSGAAAALLQIVMNPGSRIPMIGASGAISGVLGAYLVLFPRSRVVSLVFFGFLAQMIRVPAAFFLIFWFLLQFLYGTGSATGGGVAWLAHVGGFIAGIVLVFVFRRPERLAWYRR